MLIGGEWVDARSQATFESINPYTGQPWATIPRAGAEDVDAAVRAARGAFATGWGTTTGTERARLLRRLADLIASNADRIARVETTDNGKLIREMGGQLKRPGRLLPLLRGRGRQDPGRDDPADQATTSSSTRSASRSAWSAAITPWNSPLLLLSWKLAPALAAGCTSWSSPPSRRRPRRSSSPRWSRRRASRPASSTSSPASAPRRARRWSRTRAWTRSPSPARPRPASAVMKGAAEHLARVTLELGGKSPNIVFDDADLEAAANGGSSGIFAATGQTCIAGSRLFVQDAIHDELVERLGGAREDDQARRPAGPRDRDGPGRLRRAAANTCWLRSSAATEEGARARHRRRRRARTRRTASSSSRPIFAGVDNGMDIAREEIFGPVLAVMRFADEEEVDRAGQRHRLRACRRRLDPRHPARAPGGARAAGRHGLGQLLPRGRTDGALRRLQDRRHGARERPPGRRRSTPSSRRSGSSSPARRATRSSWARARCRRWRQGTGR